VADGNPHRVVAREREREREIGCRGPSRQEEAQPGIKTGMGQAKGRERDELRWLRYGK
jgi:hypothetical protein